MWLRGGQQGEEKRAKGTGDRGKEPAGEGISAQRRLGKERHRFVLQEILKKSTQLLTGERVPTLTQVVVGKEKG